MSIENENTQKAAVRCQKCNKILAFKLGITSGYLQLKCPVCKTEIKIDLSLRCGKVYNRRAGHPITIAFIQSNSEFIDSARARG